MHCLHKYRYLSVFAMSRVENWRCYTEQQKMYLTFAFLSLSKSSYCRYLWFSILTNTLKYKEILLFRVAIILNIFFICRPRGIIGKTPIRCTVRTFITPLSVTARTVIVSPAFTTIERM